jgi:hypothetical protein
MAELAAQNLPHDQATAAAEEIVHRFMPDAFAALQPAAAAAHPVSLQSPAQPVAGSPAMSSARPRLPSAAATPSRPGSGAVATPRKRPQGQAAGSRKPPHAPLKRQRTVSRVVVQREACLAAALARSAAGSGVSDVLGNGGSS